MQAIHTRYFGPTNTRGSRIKATAGAGSVTVGYRSELNLDENHAAAARKLAEKFGWVGPGYGDFVAGCLANGDYVHVADDKRLKVLRDFVNSYRDATWTGNPWSKPEFRACVETVGRAYGYFGEVYGAPTRDEEIAAWLARKA